MNTHITAPRQFRLYGAVLAMAALLAVLLAATLTAGPTMAQEPGGPGDLGPGHLPRTGDNAEEYSEFGALPCTEEEEPDADTVPIISEGYYAVFDAFWDYEDGHPSNNFCPPGVTVTEGTDPVTFLPKPDYTRHDANTHISETAFSFPDSYKVTVIDSRNPISNPEHDDGPEVEGDTIDIADFRFLAQDDAVSAVETEEDGTTVFANNTLWWVRVDAPDATPNKTSPLQVGYSTALLEEADWYKDENGDGVAEPPVQFEFEAFHVFKDGRLYKGEEAHEIGAHMFAFDNRATDTPLEDPQWSSVNTNTKAVGMQTGQYRQMQFAFTEPGSYLFQVQWKGHVRKSDDPAPAGGHAADWSPISPDEVITSPVQWYTFHVGPQAGLDVDLTAGAVSTTDGVSTVPITVTANNRGPDGAENVEVEINLPPGLNAPDPLPAGLTSNSCGVIAWKIGTMAAPTPPTETTPLTPTTSTLTFNATADSGAAGKHTVTAEIHSDTFDPDITNNAASADATLPGTDVRPPFFPGLTRSITEQAVAGTHAGDPVAANNPDGRALTYTLSGRCSNKFQVNSDGQIALAPNQTLDYEEQWEFPLTLNVSDGVNAAGEADSSFDDSIPVLIQVEDVEEKPVTVEVRREVPSGAANSGTLDRPETLDDLQLTATVEGLPEGVTPLIRWSDPNNSAVFVWRVENWIVVSSAHAGELIYTIDVRWPGGSAKVRYPITWYPFN